MKSRLRRERVAMMYDPKITGAQRLRLLAWPLLAGLVDTYDEKKAAAMFQAFVKNGTWQTPTLAILDGFVHELDDEFVNDPRRRFLPKVWTDNWDPRVIYYLRDESPAEYEVLHQRMRMLLTRYRKLVGDMHRAGVELLAGTLVELRSHPGQLSRSPRAELRFLGEVAPIFAALQQRLPPELADYARAYQLRQRDTGAVHLAMRCLAAGDSRRRAHRARRAARPPARARVAVVAPDRQRSLGALAAALRRAAPLTRRR